MGRCTRIDKHVASVNPTHPDSRRQNSNIYKFKRRNDPLAYHVSVWGLRRRNKYKTWSRCTFTCWTTAC